MILKALCRRLGKALLPPREPVLIAGYNTESAPLASTVARLPVNCMFYSFECGVLLESSRIILGCVLINEKVELMNSVDYELHSQRNRVRT